MKPVILVVDDENEAREMIINFLKDRFDCEFKEAKDGESALEFVKDHPCDLMLLDIKLPRKSGTVVIKEAKELNPKVDILVVSAYASDDVAEEALELGATDYAVKPLDLRAISLKVANILKKRGQGTASKI